MDVLLTSRPGWGLPLWDKSLLSSLGKISARSSEEKKKKKVSVKEKMGFSSSTASPGGRNDGGVRGRQAGSAAVAPLVCLLALGKCNHSLPQFPSLYKQGDKTGQI